MCKIWFILFFGKDLVCFYLVFEGAFSFYLVLVFQKDLVLV